MMLETTVMGGVYVLAPTRNLAGGDETEFLKAAVKDLAERGSSRIVIDLGKISWISSLGIEGLLSARRDCLAHNGWLRLARMGKRIDHIILVSRLSALFDTFDTVEDAVNAPVRGAVWPNRGVEDAGTHDSPNREA